MRCDNDASVESTTVRKAQSEIYLLVTAAQEEFFHSQVAAVEHLVS